jgi:nitrate/nitrite-specific signal transduction histidine kinase
MRNLESESLIDLAALSLRGLILIGMSAGLLLTGGANAAAIATLLAAAVWNIVLLAFLLFTDRRFDSRRITSLVIDLLVANLLFFSSTGKPGYLVWVGLLPVTMAALFFGLRGTFLAVLLSGISIGLQVLVFSPPDSPLLFIISVFLVLTLGGLAVMYLRRVLLKRYEQTRRALEKNRQELEKTAEERARTLAYVGEALNRDLNGERIVNTALSQSVNLLSLSPDLDRQPVGAVLLLARSEPGNVCLQMAAGSRFASEDEKVCLPSSGGLITRSIGEGQPRLSKEISKDPELNRFAPLRACQAVYCIPLTSSTDTNPLGVLLLAHPDEGIFTQERRDTLDAIGRMAGHAIRNARRYRDLDFERKRLIEILQENQSRLVRELHDGSTQSVSALALRANLIRRTFERDGKMAVEELHKLEDLARTTAKEIRQMLFTLRPLEQKPEGVETTLENLADQVRKSTGKNVVILADPKVYSLLEPKKQAVIYYIAEEAVEIAYRSGNTEPVLVRVSEIEVELACLEVEYSMNSPNSTDIAASYESRNSLSVSNMRERAALVNGYLEIEAAENQKLRIQLLVPITEEAAERLRDRQ